MGFFDKLLKNGLKAIGDAVSDAVSDVVSDALKDNFGVGNKETEQENTVTHTAREVVAEKSFEQKLTEVLANIGAYDIRKGIAPEELEKEAGKAIYTRGGCYALPDAFSYAVYQGEARVAYINNWETYETYKHFANREIKSYCENNGIKVIDFFDYLPNEIGYMENRLRGLLA